MRAVLATHNKHKVVELQRILARAGAPELELVALSAWPDAAAPAETGETFADNALIKARAAAELTGLLALADDSGIAVDALRGMPGVFSARWAGSHGDDRANVDLLLDQLDDVPDERRGASFVCAAVAAWPDGRTVVAEGRLSGRLLRSRRGAGGFGYDPVFVPDGYDVTTAELGPEAKDAISHRGLAFRDLAAQLTNSPHHRLGHRRV